MNVESTPRTFVADTWRRLRRTPGAIVGLVVVATIVLTATFAPLVAASDPLGQDLAHQALAPSGHHPFGTDKLGRDIFARIVYGARISIRIGFVAVGLAITLGTTIGTIAGYVRGRVDTLLMGAMDVMLAFPSIILAIAITTVLGPSINNLMLAVGIVYVPQYARLARSSVLAVAELEYVEAARAIGARTPEILVRHVLPNILAPLLVQATLGAVGARLSRAFHNGSRARIQSARRRLAGCARPHGSLSDGGSSSARRRDRVRRGRFLWRHREQTQSRGDRRGTLAVRWHRRARDRVGGVARQVLPERRRLRHRGWIRGQHRDCCT
ncbi:MAG: hypothetical protein NVS3B17_05210 [Vulcanimicrobiaceae bacterium]